MPRKSKRLCVINNCPNLVELDGDIFCKEHSLIEERKYEKYSRGFVGNERYDSRWKRVRNIYIEKHSFCEKCLKENKFIKATVVHYKIAHDKLRKPITNFKMGRGSKISTEIMLIIAAQSRREKCHFKQGIWWNMPKETTWKMFKLMISHY